MPRKQTALLKKITNKIRKMAGFPPGKQSYSQCGEDLIVDYIFSLRGIQFPEYLDIGANDPFFLSNTALFYKKGCRGMNIEANPRSLGKLRRFRSRDINLNIGIGPVEDELDFYILSDPTLNTFSKQEAENIAATGRYKILSVQKIKLITIEKLIDEYGNGKFPDFLSIDVEGMDFDILRSLPFEKYSPKVICVEAAEYSPIGAGARRDDIIALLVSKGYYEYANTNLNAIMVRKDFWFI
jgi:FkbM family methyltransferase